MPNNWKTYKLKEVAVLSTGFAFKSKFYEEKGTLKVIRGKNVTEGYLRWGSDAKFWNHEVEEKLKKHLLKLDDIAIGMDGSKVGKNRAIVREHDLPAILAQRVARVQNIDKLTDQKYLWQIIKSIPFERYVDNIKTGTSIPHISLGQIGDFEINLPPLKTQKQIASILSALDDKIELNLQMNKTLEDMAMALYKHWFVDFGPFQNGEFVDSELGKIPKGWEVYTLFDICDKIYSGGTPKTGVPEYWNGEIPWLASGETRDSLISSTEKTITQLGLEKSSCRMAYKYDIVIASAGQGKTRGQTSLLLVDTAINQSVMSIRANMKLIHPLTLFTDLKSRYSEFRHISDSYSTRGSLTTKLIGEQIKFALPPIELQSEVHLKLEKFIKIQENNIFENSTLIKTRDTLLPKLISGEVQVKDVEQLLN